MVIQKFFVKFGGNTKENRVSFVGGGGWWLDVFFLLHTPISELTKDPSYARTSLAPLGIMIIAKKKIIDTYPR